MRRLVPLLLLATVLVTPAVSAEKPAYPPSRVDDVVENLHGTEVHDPCRWLEDGSSAEVKAWAKDQNDFARRQLDGLAGRDWLGEGVKEGAYLHAPRGPQRGGGPPFF